MKHYIFSDQAADRELARLRLVEAAFDPKTHAWLERAGIRDGARCLEVAAGGGSVAKWMSEQSGVGGRVTAVDLKTAYLSELPPNVDLVEGDAASVDLGGPFDVAHCRYMLIHHPDAQRVIDQIADALLPGGRVVLEEPDFQAARSVTGSLDQAVQRSICSWFEAKSLDPGFGLTLPECVQRSGLEVVDVEAESHLTSGDSPVARVMAESVEALRDKYVETGVATDNDIDGYIGAAKDPEAWSVFYTTVRVHARKRDS